MAVNYAALASKAQSLLQANGTSILIERVGSGGDWTKKYDSATQRVYWEDVDENIVYVEPGDAVTQTIGYAVMTSWPVRMIDGSLIKVDDVLLIVYTSIEIVPGDKIITAASRELLVVPPVQIIRPNEETIIVQKVNGRG